MTTRAPQVATVAGAALTMHAAAAGDKISGIKRPTRMLVLNGSGAPITLTIDPPGLNEYGVANPAKVFTVAAGAYFTLTLLPVYRDPADSSLISLAWSATTTVTWAVIG